MILLFALFLLPYLLQAQPRLLLNGDDLARIEQLAATERWASDVRSEVIRTAAAFPQSYVGKYGLREADLPAEGGQWSLWYVCPTHGVSLRYTAPATHTCPVDNREWTGWPFDQVILERRHYDLAYAARDNGLAFRLTGDRRFAVQAASILLQYADRYLSYPIRDKDNRLNARSGARVGAQTLDEAIWLIPMAWAYDLLAGSDVLSADQRAHIEKDLLRACVETIQRNDAGVSNWQSWHNAGIGAVAFALQDSRLIEEVINGKSGFRFQMKNSVLGEGFWYEGAWGYHFYALDALMQLAEMAARNGVDLYGEEPNLRNLFLAPMRLLFADGSLPAFNDSGNVSLFSYGRIYEAAYARYGDPLMAAVAGRQNRGRNSLLWGAPELPRTSLQGLSSEIFPEAGYAVLRGPSSDHTVSMKFGPHGGGHGHYDKLGLISFAHGGILAVDPGTQSYAAPTHETWDKLTVAHNTVVIDERTQSEAQGKLLWHEFTDLYSAARADAGPAYRNVSLQRTLFVTREYAVDLFDVRANDGQAHAIDWVYHNYGTVKTELSTSTHTQFPRTNGYQHLVRNQAAQTAEAWKVDFDGSPRGGGNYGSVYRSNDNVQGTFEYSTDQAVSGRMAAKLSYRFTGAGYILCSTPALAGHPDRVPSAISVMIHGDGSGHTLALRINDASDERFVVAVGPVNWTGWKRIHVRDLAKGSHYLGNADGVIDTPIRNVSFELTRTVAGAPAGALYVDDLELEFAEGEPFLVSNFEFPSRSLRVWMWGEPGTTVVAGEGLGPNLLQPVLYVMARRRAEATRFVTLLEPYAEAPVIHGFRLEGETLHIESDDFTDEVTLGPAGVIAYRRR